MITVAVGDLGIVGAGVLDDGDRHRKHEDQKQVAHKQDRQMSILLEKGLGALTGKGASKR